MSEWMRVGVGSHLNVREDQQMDHDALVTLIDQHRYTLYDPDGLACECGNIPRDESYAEHLARLIEDLT